MYAIDPFKKEIVWAHKIDNSMVNTVRVLDKQHLIVSTMDGKIVLLANRLELMHTKIFLRSIILFRETALANQAR